MFRNPVFGQTKILDAMQECGYNIDTQGHCYGLTYMAMLAIYANDLETFNKRLMLIEKTANISQEITLAKDQVKMYLKESQIFAEQEMKNKNFTTPEEYQKAFNRRVNELVNQKITPKEQQWLEVAAFFDGVQLMQNTKLYAENFQDQKHPDDFSSIRVLPFLKSRILEEQEKAYQSARMALENPTLNSAEIADNKTLEHLWESGQAIFIPNTISSKNTVATGGVVNVDNFSGIYDQNELLSYFRSLRIELSRSPRSTQPITLTLSSYNHIIMVSYDAKKNTWLFTDANQLPPQEIKHSADLVRKITTGFPADIKELKNILNQTESAIEKDNIIKAWETKRIALSTRVYSNQHDQLDISKKLNIWKKQKEFQTIHSIAAKFNDRDMYQKTWLSMEVDRLVLYGGDTTTLKKLIAAGSPVDNNFNLACAQQNTNIITAFIKVGEVNKSWHGFTPLTTAIYSGHIDTVKELIANGAKIDFDAHLISALDIAVNRIGTTDVHEQRKNYYNISIIILKEINNFAKEKIETIYKLLELANQDKQDDVLNFVLQHLTLDSEKEVLFKLVTSAVDYNNNALLKLLIPIMQKKEVEQITWSTLASLIINNNVDILKILIEKGINLNLKHENTGANAAFLAAEYNRPDILTMLAKYKPDLLDEPRIDGATPALIAAEDGNLEVLKVLVANKVDLNKADQDGYRPVDVAAAMAHLKILEFLAQHDVDLNLPPRKGKPSPLEILKHNISSEEYAKFLESLSKVKEATILKKQGLFSHPAHTKDIATETASKKIDIKK